MPVKITLTMPDGTMHDFLSMDDAVAAHADMVAAQPAPEVPAEEAPADVPADAPAEEEAPAE